MTYEIKIKLKIKMQKNRKKFRSKQRTTEAINFLNNYYQSNIKSKEHNPSNKANISENKSENKEQIKDENNINENNILSEKSHSNTKLNDYILLKNTKKKLYNLNDLADANLYNLLGVNEDCNDTELRLAYKELCLKNHPDKGGNQNYFIRIKEAYSILSMPVTRKIFDRYGSKSLKLLRQFIEINKCSPSVVSNMTDEEIEQLDLFFE